MTEERPSEAKPEGEGPAPDLPASSPPPYTPSYTPPPIAPPAPQPAVSWAPPPTAQAATGQRSTLSLVAGILLILLGALGALFSLALLTIGREVIKQFDFSGVPGLGDVNDPNAVVASVLTFLGVFVLACSAFYILSGVGVIRSANWGRVIGIIIGILAGLIWLGSLLNVGRSGPRDDVSFALVLLALHVYIAIALLFFWRNKAPA